MYLKKKKVDVQLSNPSIVMDASEYIKGLKQKIARLNQEIAREEDTHSQRQNSFPTVRAQTYHRTVYVNVYCIEGLNYPVLKLRLCTMNGRVLYWHIVIQWGMM